jgi:multisubunit Na+/H+ antiporter MnhB subunit
MARLALALAYFLSFVGVMVLLFLSFRTSPDVAYTGVLLFASGKAIKLALAGEDQ